MSDEKTVSNIGETRLIEVVEEIIHEVTGKSLVRDDSFFFNLKNALLSKDNGEKIVVLFIKKNPERISDIVISIKNI